MGCIMKKNSLAKFMVIITILLIPLFLMASTLDTTNDFNNFYEEITSLQSQLNGVSQSLYISNQKGESLTSLQNSLSIYNSKIKNLNTRLFDYATNSNLSSIDKIRTEALIVATRLLNDLYLILSELLITEDYEIEYKLFKAFFSANSLLTQGLSSFPI